MNKRILIIITILLILTIGISLFFANNNDNNNLPSTPIINNNEKTVEVTDSIQIEKIKTDAYLNILLQVKNFDSLNISYEPLLEAAMRIAGVLNLYQTSENGMYVEYVPRATIHELIYELSGIRIEEPIIIEDFYYLYDATGDYYYIVPIGSSWLELSEISSIHYTSDSDQYIIRCSAENLSDYAIKTIYPNIELHLKYKASNNYIKYQLISINAGKSEVEILEPEEHEYYDDYNNYDLNFNDNISGDLTI